MGQIRALASRDLGAAVVVVCDLDGDRAHKLAEKVGARSVVDIAEVHLEELDALFLCTPPSVREIGAKAIKCGVHLLVEKPLGVSTRACEPLIQALDSHPVITAVGYMNRYRPGVSQVRASLAKETPIGITINWFGGRYGVPWWYDPKQSGGPINEQCTHLVDICRYLIGEIVSVQAIVPTGASIAETDTIAVAVRFANEVLGTLLYSCKAAEKLVGLKIYTAHHSLCLEGWDFRLPEDNKQSLDKNAIFTIEVQSFLNAIITGESNKIRSDLRDALRTQRVVDAILKAASDGRVVDIE
jgi:predicted dehydrogenase